MNTSILFKPKIGFLIKELISRKSQELYEPLTYTNFSSPSVMVSLPQLR